MTTPSREAMALVKSLLWAMGNLDDASANDAALALDAAIRAGAVSAIEDMIRCGDVGVLLEPRPAPAATCACPPYAATPASDDGSDREVCHPHGNRVPCRECELGGGLNLAPTADAGGEKFVALPHNPTYDDGPSAPPAEEVEIAAKWIERRAKEAVPNYEDDHDRTLITDFADSLAADAGDLVAALSSRLWRAYTEVTGEGEGLLGYTWANLGAGRRPWIEMASRLAAFSAARGVDYEAAAREGSRQLKNLARDLNANREGVFTLDTKAIVDAALHREPAK